MVIPVYLAVVGAAVNSEHERAAHDLASIAACGIICLFLTWLLYPRAHAIGAGKVLSYTGSDGIDSAERV